MEENKINTIAFLSEVKYTNNENLDSRYKKNTSVLVNGVKGVLMYNFCLCFGFYYFSRNVIFFKNKFTSRSQATLGKIATKTLMYTLGPFVVLLPNIFILLGSNPLKVFRERRQLEDDLLTKDEVHDTLSGFSKMYQDNIGSTYNEKE